MLELGKARSTPHGPCHADVLSLRFSPGAAVTLQAATLVAFPGAGRGLPLISAPPCVPSAVKSLVTWRCGWYSWKLYAARLLRILHMSQNLPACVGVCPAHVGEIEEIICSLNQIMCVNNLQALITPVGRHGVRGL